MGDQAGPHIVVYSETPTQKQARYESVVELWQLYSNNHEWCRDLSLVRKMKVKAILKAYTRQAYCDIYTYEGVGSNSTPSLDSLYEQTIDEVLNFVNNPDE